MATNKQKVLNVIKTDTYRQLPDSYQAIGHVKEPNCDDELIIAFSTQREIITHIGYQLTESACPPLFACAITVCRLAHQKSVLEAYLINEKDIEKQLSDDGQLDQESIHCAIMAELALKRAIIQYSQRKKQDLENEK